MKSVAPILFPLIAFAGANANGKPAIHDSKSSEASLAQEADCEIRTTANRFLAGYFKAEAGHHLCQVKLGSAPVLVDLKELQLTHIISSPASAAEMARGITESATVQISYTSYRTYDPRKGVWSRECQSPNGYLPAAVKIVRVGSGRWQAVPNNFHQLVRYSEQGSPAVTSQSRSQFLAGAH